MADTVFISHQSALQFWRTHDLEPSGGIVPNRVTSLKDSIPSLQQALPLIRNAGPTTGKVYGGRDSCTPESAMRALDIGGPPLHIMVDTRSKQHSTKNLVSHLCAQALPEGSFCRVDEHVMVASPELTLAQLALGMPLVDVLQIALEFCGGYALDAAHDGDFAERPALTSADRIAAFAKRLNHTRGGKLLSHMLPYIADNSASPMESIALMLLCLPSKVGGYQLPLPLLNQSIDIPEHARSRAGRRRLVCDLYWEACQLDVECDSTKFHTSKEQLGLDSDRRAILDAMGFSYVSITWWQMEQADEFRNVVKAIRRAMGLSTLRKAPEHITTNRNNLREYLTAKRNKRMPLRLTTASGRRSEWSS